MVFDSVDRERNGVDLAEDAAHVEAIPKPFSAGRV
jgi:hypothetical protein